MLLKVNFRQWIQIRQSLFAGYWRIQNLFKKNARCRSICYFLIQDHSGKIIKVPEFGRGPSDARKICIKLDAKKALFAKIKLYEFALTLHCWSVMARPGTIFSLVSLVQFRKSWSAATVIRRLAVVDPMPGSRFGRPLHLTQHLPKERREHDWAWATVTNYYHYIP